MENEDIFLVNALDREGTMIAIAEAGEEILTAETGEREEEEELSTWLAFMERRKIA